MRKDSVRPFFELIRAGLWSDSNPDIRIEGTTDWNGVYQLAHEQSVQGIVLQGIEWIKNHNNSSNLNANIPQVLLLQWIGEVQIIEQRNKAMNQFIADLIAKMRKAGIYTLLVKGQGIAQCYERPLWRSSGDVDILLNKDDFFKAQSFLMNLASSSEPLLKEERHQEFVIDSWVVEIHGDLPSYFSKETDRILGNIQESLFERKNVRLWRYEKTDIFLPNIDDDILFVFTHLLKHFFRGGIGLRQICDLSRLLWTYRESIDVALLEKRLLQMELLSEWHAFATLAVDWLGMPKYSIPLYSDKTLWKRKAKRIISFILQTGNFGHNRDYSYYKKYPYLVGKVISFYWRLMDNIRYFFIFPLDSFRVLMWLLSHGSKNLIRTK